MEDARRLHALFVSYVDQLKEQGKPSSQDAISEALGFGQSALNQYIKGRIPLAGPSLKKFCDVLGVPPDKISPSIAEAERQKASWWFQSSEDQPVDVKGLKIALMLERIKPASLKQAAYAECMYVLNETMQGRSPVLQVPPTQEHQPVQKSTPEESPSRRRKQHEPERSQAARGLR